jgi:hypothetical protein
MKSRRGLTRGRLRRLGLERLEQRLALVIDFAFSSWIEQGPGPIANGQVEGLGGQNSPVSGAVEALAAHPSDADTAQTTCPPRPTSTTAPCGGLAIAAW